jgi:hypothetical protein
VQPGPRPPGKVGGDLCGKHRVFRTIGRQQQPVWSYDAIVRCVNQLAPFSRAAFPVSSGWEWSVRKMWALVDLGEFHLQISSSGTYHISIRVQRARVLAMTIVRIVLGRKPV